MMTVGDYLSNPYGRGVSAFSSSHIRDQVQQELSSNYPSPISYKIYGSKKNDIIIHCKLPSRTKAGISYDVVFQINISMANEKTRQTIARFPFKCFSNSPSFYYTFAKAYHEQDMICDWLWKKYDRKVRRKDAEVRNPSRIVGYERTIYTCLWYVYQQLRNQNVLDLYKRAIAASFGEIADQVATQEDIELRYEKAPYSDLYKRKKEEREKKRQAERQEREAKKQGRAPVPNATAKTKKTGHTKTLSKSGSTKRTATSSKTKKI